MYSVISSFNCNWETIVQMPSSFWKKKKQTGRFSGIVKVCWDIKVLHATMVVVNHRLRAGKFHQYHPISSVRSGTGIFIYRNLTLRWLNYHWVFGRFCATSCECSTKKAINSNPVMKQEKWNCLPTVPTSIKLLITVIIPLQEDWMVRSSFQQSKTNCSVITWWQWANLGWRFAGVGFWRDSNKMSFILQYANSGKLEHHNDFLTKLQRDGNI